MEMPVVRFQQLEIETSSHRIGRGQRLYERPDFVERRWRYEIAERKADHVADRDAEAVRDICRCVEHQPIGRQGDQAAERLHVAEQMDRLAVAIGKVDFHQFGSMQRGPAKDRACFS